MRITGNPSTSPVTSRPIAGTHTRSVQSAAIGWPETVAVWMGYLFEEQTHLVDIDWRATLSAATPSGRCPTCSGRPMSIDRSLGGEHCVAELWGESGRNDVRAP